MYQQLRQSYIKNSRQNSEAKPTQWNSSSQLIVTNQKHSNTTGSIAASITIGVKASIRDVPQVCRVDVLKMNS